MDIGDTLAAVKTLARFQRCWTSISFTRFGSLYYAKDLDEPDMNEPLYVGGHGNGIENGKFAIGLFTGREFFDAGRSAIAFDRGPCKLVVGSRDIPKLTRQNEYSCRTITLRSDIENWPVSNIFLTCLYLH